MWDEFGNLICSTCSLTFASHGRNNNLVAELARFKGWHLFDGETIAGVPLTSHLCPKCVGTNRSRLPPSPLKLEDDQALF